MTMNHKLDKKLQEAAEALAGDIYLKPVSYDQSLQTVKDFARFIIEAARSHPDLDEQWGGKAPEEVKPVMKVGGRAAWKEAGAEDDVQLKAGPDMSNRWCVMHLGHLYIVDEHRLTPVEDEA